MSKNLNTSSRSADGSSASARNALESPVKFNLESDSSLLFALSAHIADRMSALSVNKTKILFEGKIKL